jgi:hypothetical protein
MLPAKYAGGTGANGQPLGLSRRQATVLRWGALKTERATWLNRWRDITEYLLPFAGRYFVQDRNRGDKSFNSIYDSTATRALRILAAGMMAGMTSPARPWFRLGVMDPYVMERESVKVWLNDVAELMRTIFAKSNTYRALHSMYEELGAFNTAVNIIEPNFDTVLWNHPLTAGEYAIGCDGLGRVNTVYREFEMTVAQIVEEYVWDEHTETFDWSKCSPAVKTLWDTGKGYDQWRPIIHAIEPRLISERTMDRFSRKFSKNMPWRSVYVENDVSDDVILRESGFHEAPFIAPRWHTRGRDIYGNGPGMEALGDIKQLQHEQLRKGQAIDYMALPAVVLPSGVKGREVDSLPGGVSHSGASGVAEKAHNLFDIKLDLQHLLGDIVDVRTRINQMFYADLFLMISNDQRRMPVTAREIAERHEEKLLMLGPVLERLHDEMLSPLIDATFSKIIRAGLLRGPLAPPPELQGMDLKIEFVSTLAQAQKAVGLNSFDRLLGTISLIGQGSQDPGVWDKLDKDEIVDKYADMLAVDPSVIVADEKVALIRADRQKQQAASQMAANAPAMAGAAKDASQIDVQNLRDVTRGVMGYT